MTVNLDPIARFTVEGQALETLVLESLAEENGLARAYNVLAMRVWQIVAHRHTADHLRELHNLILDIKAKAGQRGETTLAGRFHALADQLQLSINMSGSPRMPDIMRRAHVPNILAALISADKGRMSTDTLRAHLGLQPANLTNLLNLLILAELVACDQDHTAVRITREGKYAVSSYMPPMPKEERFPLYDVTVSHGVDLLSFAEGLRKASIEVTAVIGMLNMITIRAMDHQVNALRSLTEIAHIEESVPVAMTPHPKRASR